MKPRISVLAFLIVLCCATGCVRRAISQSFGLSRSISHRTSRKAASTSPDDALRSIFRKQTQGAFDPLTDDPHVQTLKKNLKADPADNASRLELAAAFEGYRLYTEASEQYAEAMRLDPAEAAALGFARCAQALGQAREAVPVLESFLKKTPSPNVWELLGLLHDQLGDLKSGESAFRSALKDGGTSDRLHNNLGYNLLLQKKPDNAETEFRKALDINPNSPVAHNNLGLILARRGDLDLALDQFQSAADAATAHNNLAAVLLETGQYEKSRDELTKALAIRHNFAPALANFKLVQEKIQEKAEIQRTGRLPLSAVRIPPPLIALSDVRPPGQPLKSASKDSEDRQ